MDFAQLIATNMPSSVSVGGAAISILAAIGTFVLSRSLEKAKAGYQTTLEQRKGELQSDLEGRKRDLQEELEGVKAGYQRDLELRKNELQSSLEGQKLIFQKELEEFKAGISNELASQNARRSYEYDARKNLYAKVEPLLFQLFEAAEGAFHAVTSLARTQRQGDLPAWLAANANKYYIR
jgi:ABC-type multidrug transport system fused ATPase/permease subunit